MKKYQRVAALIDLDAIEENFEAMRAGLPAGTKMAAVVKANGYGHGAVPIARLLESKDAVWGFAAATIEEALALRSYGIRKPVLVLGYVFPESYPEPRRIATIPVGYGDGYPRSLSDRGCVLIAGKRAPIRGRVCMDQFMVDVTEIPEARPGMEVTLFGTDGGEILSMDELAELSGRFNYEFACDISGRVPRIYLRHGEITETAEEIWTSRPAGA